MALSVLRPTPATTDENTARPWRRALCKILVPTYLTLIFGIPTLALSATWTVFEQSSVRWLAVLVAPLAATLMFALTAGVLSLPHRKWIVAGKFPRDTGHQVYFHRRLYGLCWTSLYYNKPVYFLCLTLPVLKLLTFRLFGYRGSMDFTIYPDTWIRDLPLLNLGKGAYIANRSTLGTNLCLPNGETMVGAVTVGENALVGHLVAIACGSSLGAGAEVGACAAVGYRSSIGAGTKVAGRCVVEHGVVIGENCTVGTASYVGSASKISDGVDVLAGSNVPQRSRIGSSKLASTYASYTALLG